MDIWRYIKPAISVARPIFVKTLGAGGIFATISVVYFNWAFQQKHSWDSVVVTIGALCALAYWVVAVYLISEDARKELQQDNDNGRIFKRFMEKGIIPLTLFFSVAVFITAFYSAAQTVLDASAESHRVESERSSALQAAAGIRNIQSMLGQQLDHLDSIDKQLSGIRKTCEKSDQGK